MIQNLVIIKFTKIAYLLSLFCLSLLATSTTNAKQILIYGDSLSAAYGMDIEQGWVYLLNDSLQEKHQVSNASISGETSGGGLERLPFTLDNLKPDIVIIALGANDGLRGYPTKRLTDNLTAMIKLVKQANMIPVIAGISIPPSYGPRYIDQLRAAFPQVASENEVLFIDLFRENFFNTPGFIQEDGLHPTPITQPIIRDLFLSFFAEQDLLN